MLHTLTSLTASLHARWLQIPALLIGSIDGLVLACLRAYGAPGGPVALLAPLLALSTLPLNGSDLRRRHKRPSTPDPRQIERLSALERWRCYQHQRRQVVLAYQQQIARAVMWDWSSQALQLEEQRAVELRYLDAQCANTLRELHAGLAGDSATWDSIMPGPDGTLPAAPMLIQLANLPVGALLPPITRLPFQGLAHQLAHDHRQGAWLRQSASAASSEPPTTAVLTLAMKRFAETVCANAGIHCCERCQSFGVAHCARCQGLGARGW